jgi:DNA repair protein RadC
VEVSGMKRKPQLVSDLPRVDRPREKLAQKGSSALSDAELLAVIIGQGTKGSSVLAMADEILKFFAPSKLGRLPRSSSQSGA